MAFYLVLSLDRNDDFGSDEVLRVEQHPTSDLDKAKKAYDECSNSSKYLVQIIEKKEEI